MQKFLVTGAAGFIGSHSVDRLLDQGYVVVGVDNLRSGALENLAAASASPHFGFVQADVNHEPAMEALFREHRFAGVLHLAALASVPESFDDPELNFRTNVVASERLARLCITHDCPRLVFASSAAVYGDPTKLPSRETDSPQPRSPYAAAKLAAEVMLLSYAQNFGLETLCFRYFNIYGRRQNPRSPYSGVLSIFTERFRAGLPVTVYGDGEQTRDFVAVEDVARINTHALTADKLESGRYNICTGEAVSLNRVLAIYQEIYADPLSIQYAAPRAGDIRHSLGDAGRLERMLDIRSRVPFGQGLRRLIASQEQ